jgi:hypothetical protein
MFGQPRDLVTRAATRLCQAIAVVQPAKPAKFILMSSVSVHRPGGLDTRRGSFERAIVWLLRGLLPPANDNQKAADYLCTGVRMDSPFVQWVAVRPDSLLDGDVSDYALHEGLISMPARPDSRNMANVAHVMCELAENPAVYDWAGKPPVIVNASPTG